MGIIVVGVLIALGAEQVVESFHWRHVVSETEESLTATVADAHGAMLSRLEMQGCVDRRLAEIVTILWAHGAVIVGSLAISATINLVAQIGQRAAP